MSQHEASEPEYSSDLDGETIDSDSQANNSDSLTVSNWEKGNDPLVNFLGLSDDSSINAADSFSEQYIIGSKIAQGGMGEIHEAVDRNLRRQVVVKRLRRRSAKRKGHVKRFIREAQITAQLQHPGIVPVHEFGVEDDEPYFTMKQIEGETLEHIVRKLHASNPEYLELFPLRHRLRIFVQACQAIQFAHSRGIIHRDIKPSNVMVGGFGEVLVLDWGLAKHLNESHQPLEDLKVSTTESTTIQADVMDAALRTRVGQVVGTPLYMPPEQATGKLESIDERTDIFSLGALLLSLAVFRPPYSLDGAMPVLLQARQGKVRWPGQLETDPDVPPELIAVIFKAMAFDPEERYATVSELINDIEAFLSHTTVSAYHYSLSTLLINWAQRNKALVAAVGCAIIALIVGIGLKGQFDYMRRMQRVNALLADAESLLKAEQYEESKKHYTKVLGLEPGHIAAEVGFRKTVLAADRAQRRKLSAKVRSKLEQSLTVADQSHKAFLEQREQSAELRTKYYQHQSDALSWSRELLRLDSESLFARRCVQNLARRMSRRLCYDKQFVMAEVLLREAKAQGLSDTVFQAEWAFQNATRFQQQRANATKAEQIVGKIAVNIRTSDAELSKFADELVEICDDRVVEILLRNAAFSPMESRGQDNIFSDHHLYLAAAVLSRVDKTKHTVGIQGFKQEMIANLPIRLDSWFVQILHPIVAEAYSKPLNKHSGELIFAIRLLTWSLQKNQIYFARLTRSRLYCAVIDAICRSKNPVILRMIASALWSFGPHSTFWKNNVHKLQGNVLKASANPDPFEKLNLVHWSYIVGDTENAQKWLSQIQNEQCFADPEDSTHLKVLQAYVWVQSKSLKPAENLCRELLETQPDLADAHYILGLIARERKQFDSAIDSFTRSSVLTCRAPGEIEKAEILAELGRVDDAVLSCNSFIKSNKNSPRAHLLRAELLTKLGQYEQALADYDRLLVISRDKGAVHFLKGHVYLTMDRPRVALAAFENALTFHPNNLSYILARSRALRLSVRDYQRESLFAISAVQAYLAHVSAKDAKNKLAIFEEAELAVQGAKVDMFRISQSVLETAYNKLNSIRDESDPKWLSLMAEICSFLQLTREQRQYLLKRQSIVFDFDCGLQIVELHTVLKDFDKAQATLNDLERSLNNKMQLKRRKEFLHKLTWFYIYTQNFSKGLKELQQRLQHLEEPTLKLEVYWGIGQLAFMSKDIQKAHNSYLQALKIDRKNLEIWAELTKTASILRDDKLVLEGVDFILSTSRLQKFRVRALVAQMQLEERLKKEKVEQSDAKKK